MENKLTKEEIKVVVDNAKKFHKETADRLGSDHAKTKDAALYVEQLNEKYKGVK